MLQLNKSGTFFSSLRWKSARVRCSSCFGFLPRPSATARHLSCHCGCGMLETQWNKREPKLHFPWHQSGIVGPGGRRCWVRQNSDGAFAPTVKDFQLRKQRQLQSSKYTLAILPSDHSRAFTLKFKEPELNAHSDVKWTLKQTWFWFVFPVGSGCSALFRVSSFKVVDTFKIEVNKPELSIETCTKPAHSRPESKTKY